MKCPSCSYTYSDSMKSCPRCKVREANRKKLKKSAANPKNKPLPSARKRISQTPFPKKVEEQSASMPNGGLRNNDTTALRAALGIVSPEEPESIAPIDVPNAEENETASEIKEAKTVSLEDKASKYFDRRPTDLSPQIEGTFSSLKAVWEADDEDILHEKQGSNAASQEDPLAIEFQELIGDDESVEDFCESADFLETESEDESSTDDQKAVSEDLSEEEEDSDDDINELLEAVTDYDDEEAEEEAEQEEEPEDPEEEEEEEEEEPLDPEASLAATRAIESSYINLREYIKDGNKPKESGIAAAIKGKK